jgi:ribosomal protein S18 acetylase RimI-like enzyme
MPVETPSMLLEPRQTDAVGAALARAFFDDPLFVWGFPDEQRRARLLDFQMKTFLRYGQRWGEVQTTAANAGAAIWLPPGDTRIRPLRAFRIGLWRMPFVAGLGNFRRFYRGVDHLEHFHDDVEGPHHYLAVLGVEPELQGRGVGSALIAPVLERATADGLPCYLETVKERNVTFYRKHGFEVMVETQLPPDGPPAWTMLRPA